MTIYYPFDELNERYAVNEEKSVDCILDYIGKRLEALDYKNIVIFGTSALFYLDGVIKDNIETQMQSRITKALDSAHESMEEAIKQEIRNIFSDIGKHRDDIGNSYKQLFSDFECDFNIAKNSTDAHKAVLLRDIGTFNEIKVNL